MSAGQRKQVVDTGHVGGPPGVALQRRVWIARMWVFLDLTKFFDVFRRVRTSYCRESSHLDGAAGVAYHPTMVAPGLVRRRPGFSVPEM